MLRFELIAPPEGRRGEPVVITLRLTNVSDHAVEAHFLGREIAFDVVVRGEDGSLVWQRLAGRSLPSILQMRVLAPGEVLEWKDVWHQRTTEGTPVEAGTYILQGVLPGDAAPRRSPEVRVRIG